MQKSTRNGLEALLLSNQCSGQGELRCRCQEGVAAAQSAISMARCGVIGDFWHFSVHHVGGNAQIVTVPYCAHVMRKPVVNNAASECHPHPMQEISTFDGRR